MTLRLIGIGGLGKMLGPSATYLQEKTAAYYLRMYDRGTPGDYRDECRAAWHLQGTQLVASVEELIGDGEFDGIVICAGKNGDDEKIIKELLGWMTEKKSYFILHFSTVSCHFVRATHKFCQQKNIQYVNYPLTGGAKGAATAKMLILASGDKALYERLLPMLNKIGVPNYFGEEVAQAAAVKFISHVMVFHGLLGISLAAILHKKIAKLPTLNAEQIAFFDFLNNGAGGTKQWDVMLRQALQHNNWQDGFLLKHAAIDVIYTIELMQEYQMPSPLILPLLEVALLFAYLLSQPQGELLATSAVAEMLDRLPSQTIEDFLLANLSLDSKTGIQNCIHLLPKTIQQTLLLDVHY